MRGMVEGLARSPAQPLHHAVVGRAEAEQEKEQRDLDAGHQPVGGANEGRPGPDIGDRKQAPRTSEHCDSRHRHERVATTDRAHRNAVIARARKGRQEARQAADPDGGSQPMKRRRGCQDRSTLEAPHRVGRTLADLASTVGADRPVVVARELTKLHEEIWRTTVGAAAEVAGLGEPRGEHVLVLAGAPPSEVTDDELTDDLQALLASGATRRDAVDEVASNRGVSRKRVYALALEL